MGASVSLVKFCTRGLLNMKLDTLIAGGASALVWLAAFPTIALDKVPDKTDFAILSICHVEQYVEAPLGNQRITIESGMGDGGFPVATKSRLAQQWFNYGVKLYHAFYHGDAKQAFDKAVAADPDCSMCLWAQALSRGPTMNFDVSDDDIKSGLAIAYQAQAAARTEREKILTTAMVKRYSRPQDVAAERDFASDILRAEAAGPQAADLRLLASEVLMTAWRRGDHTTAVAALELIEPILRASPENTAAIHYYIHATEYAGKAALALPYADTYFHIGRYEDAAVINASALEVDAQHLTDTATPGPPAQTDYYEHNLEVGMAGALMSGDRSLALKFADHVHKAYPNWANAHDGLSDVEGQRFVIYARYDPTNMLSLPEPSSDNPQTRSLYHYARGEAFAALHDAAGLSREIPQVTGNTPVTTVAKLVLTARLAMLNGHYAEAAQAFENAAAQQDALLAWSMDPPRWWYPIRRSAAAAWLLDGQFARAAEVAQSSLAGWPADPLALLVLSRADDRLGLAADARRAEAAAIGNWEGNIAKVDITVI